MLLYDTGNRLIVDDEREAAVINNISAVVRTINPHEEHIMVGRPWANPLPSDPSSLPDSSLQTMAPTFFQDAAFH